MTGLGVSKSYSKSYIHLLIAQALGAEQEDLSSLITELENNHLSKEEIISAQKIKKIKS